MAEERVPIDLAQLDNELSKLGQELRTVAARRLELLRQRLDFLDRLLQERQQTLEEVRKLEALLAEEGAKDATLPRSWPVAEGEFRDMPVWEAAREILRRMGTELTSSELAEAMRAGGKELGKSASSQVNATLTQKGTVFSSTKSGGKRRWRLREWDEGAAPNKEMGLAPDAGS